ncbi:MAG: hydrogenase maturation nickel metallochaperone HypA [Candidatus Marinimicrobia bacterium]|jgi:hydrogenase nickel incorporation protein HypA/HybF|nr:hydrogenase maturation nickel metallochaperone HypA [Candidatus Neomarinimicrobiota bacterium]MDP6456581.1 hydrogenase maturation nickel metallochaperone HypA [Candidatus Neomarinimicrobiota bacterium]MDP6593109.1 hydrogenase maturation nickel metallochaperone HypA [Candidatus Neomarinimicrobiota bacterium]MDP6836798.1 hydrogenase maturation nickel metallochaperone HypA [Candidatus Neomarinimicrobiota bacterium]MDP6965778.1 hydrogenase maturation nickel metallochaperone HypA [Candidatus Neom|tara:strand:- start:131 stop:472 length:342 start_codon:yes stop_codon:yes gene_type:complete
MHEMSIALSIVDIASKTATNNQAHKVSEIEVEIGVLAGVVIDSLEFCFDAACKGTLAQDARLDIVSIPAKGRCHNCQQDCEIDGYLPSCPVCGGFKIDITQGKELTVKSVLVD